MVEQEVYRIYENLEISSISTVNMYTMNYRVISLKTRYGSGTRPPLKRREHRPPTSMKRQREQW